MMRAITASSGARREALFQALLSSFLFAYMGLVLAVIMADVLFLARPNPFQQGRSYLFSIATNPEVLATIKGAFLLSMLTACVTTVLALIFGIPAAYALSRYRFPGATFIDTVIDLPIVVPPLILGLSLLAFFNQTSAGRFLDGVLSVVYTPRGIVVAQFFIATAFCIRSLKASFDQINPRFESVARTLGSSPFYAFFRVTLPLAKSGMLAGAVMTWARAMGEFAPILVLVSSTANVLSVQAYLNLSAGYIEVSFAIAVFMVFIATVTLLAFKKLGGQGYIW